MKLSILLLGLVACTFAFAGAPPEPSRLDCSGAFSESPAARSCGLQSVRTSGHMCKLEVWCRRDDGTRGQITTNVSVGDARNQHNCNGLMRTGGC